MKTALCSIVSLILMPFCLAAANAGQTKLDYLLKGGRVIDPKNGTDSVLDVGILDGKIASLEEEIPASQAEITLDVTGTIVTPGLIDTNTHLYHTVSNPTAWAGDYSVKPDVFSFRTGVTTMVDAGTAGWRNFERFRVTVIDVARTRVLAMINIAGFGKIHEAVQQVDFNPEAVAELAAKHPDVVVGVNSGHYKGRDWVSVDKAIEAGRLAKLPVMVDFGSYPQERPFWELVTKKLRDGDIASQCFRGPIPWADENGKLYPYLHTARERGVKFEVGHGGASFVFRNAIPAVKSGFFPDSISTNLHAENVNAAMQDLPNVMSKFLAMGMPLDKVVEAATWKPAQIIGRPELGHLSIGAEADVAVFKLAKGSFRFRDTKKAVLIGDTRLRSELTLKAGVLVWDWDSRYSFDMESLGPEYGVRPELDEIVLPPKQTP